MYIFSFYGVKVQYLCEICKMEIKFVTLRIRKIENMKESNLLPLPAKKEKRKLGFLKGKVKFSTVGDGKITEEEFLIAYRAEFS